VKGQPEKMSLELCSKSTDGRRAKVKRRSGSKFQATGAAMKKLRLSSQLFWFVERTDRRARSIIDIRGTITNLSKRLAGW